MRISVKYRQCVCRYRVKDEIFTSRSSSYLLENLGNFMKLQICPNVNDDCTHEWSLIELTKIQEYSGTMNLQRSLGIDLIALY